jgi:4-amino-4-deoxychorismate lyase
LPLSAAIWVDGAPSDSLPLPDRGLDFGDGVFETLLLENGRAHHAGLHLQRLRAGLESLYFPDCVALLAAAADQLQQAMAAAGEFPRTWCALRLTVTRGGAPRGYAPPAKARPRIVTTLNALQRNCSELAAPARLTVASVRCSGQPVLAGIKHLNRLEQVLAAREAQLAGCDEAVILDRRGNVISVTAGNLFLFHDGQLCTPLLDECGVQGTRRRLVLERWAPALGLAVAQVRVTQAQLEAADEVFYCNSLLGLRPVGSCGMRRWYDHPLCRALHDICWETPR